MDWKSIVSCFYSFMIPIPGAICDLIEFDNWKPPGLYYHEFGASGVLGLGASVISRLPVCMYE